MRPRRVVAAIMVVAAATLSACGGQSSSFESATTTTRSATEADQTTHANGQRSARRRSTHQHSTHRRSTRNRATRPRHRPRPAHQLALAAPIALLPVSHSSSTVVQPQPSPGSCHAKGSGLFSQPDPSCTPGALNPAVAQATIGQTICMSGYSASVRPSGHITAKEKLASMAAYGDNGSPSDFEYDHLVSLELGGAANDPRNLWPEPGNSPNPKDSVENALHGLVCSGQMRLSQAQKIIATGWVAYYKSHGFG